MILRKNSALTTLGLLIASSVAGLAATAVPGKIEAESYTSMVGVQAETCNEGGQNVGWIDAGDSMTYSITVPTSGSYTIEYRVSSPYATCSLNSSFGGTSLGSVAIPNTGGWQTWQTVSQTVNLTAGTNNLVISAATGGWNLNWINVISNGGGTGGGSTVTVPAKIEAEAYVSMVGVATEACGEGTQNVGWIDTGDTMTYSIAVPTTGSYTLQYRVASPNANGVIGASFGGTSLGTVAVPSTGAWQTWQTVNQTVNLTAGTNNLVISAPTGGWNLNWINVVSNGGGGGSSVTIPAKIEAEKYTSMIGVDLETCGEGTQNVGWIDAGDSMTYAITVPTAGTYTIEYRVAAPAAGGVISSTFNGTALGNVSVPATGGWQVWQTVSQSVSLPAGSGNFVIKATAAGWNLNWINFISGGVKPTISVAITPSSATLAPGATQIFTAAVTGTTNTAVTWSTDGGTIDASGKFTAPTALNTYHVKATSVADTSVSATAAISVVNNDMEARITSLINQMSLSEKILQVHGTDAFNTADNTRLGIPGFHMADGSYGRIGGTLWPCPIATGNTWDPDLTKRYGVAEGKEFRSTGSNVALSPMLNLLRDGRWGRSSESYGEDSFLVGELATAQIQGIQSVKAIAEAKHFACYNSFSGMVTVSERSLRENYLPHFEKAIKAGDAKVVMAAYNGVNGYSCTANKHLLTDILKNEWGFQGFVNSDWGSIYNCDAAAIAGTDLAMPSYGGFETLEADVNAGKVPMSRIDDMVRRILRVKGWAGMLDAGYTPTAYKGQINSADSRSVSLEIARKSIVLAKNTNALLPLSKTKATKVAIMADLAPAGFGTNTNQPVTWATSYNDGYRGSTYIGCVEVPKTFTQGIQAKAAGTSVTLVGDPATADVILYFTGVPGAGENQIEGEGFERTIQAIPVTAQMTDTMNKYAAKTVVVVTGGSTAVKGPWSAAAGIIIALFPGIDQAQALSEILFGEVNPSGKLAATWPTAGSDLPAFDLSTQPYEEAWEGTGWHYFEAKGIQPFLEFGRGLSYTTYNYGTPTSTVIGNEIVVTLNVTNAGAMAGEEVVQAYVSKPNSTVQRRVKDLRGFKRVSLAPGETKQVEIRIQKNDLRYWDTTGSTWILEPGAYTLSVGSSSKDIRVTGSFNL